MTDDTARAEPHETTCGLCGERVYHAARPSGLLREAAQAVVDEYMSTDEDEEYLSPDFTLKIAALDAALAADEPGLDEALRDFMEERLEDAHEMTPAEERLMKVARAALAATEPGLDE